MKRLIPIAVGIALVVALLVALVPGRGGAMTVTAYFPDSAGLFEGNDVGILGVKVGTIESIEPMGTQVKVTMSVDDERDIPKDVAAVVVARSVATDRYVELTPVYTQGPKLGDGDAIALDHTRTPVEFDEVLESINSFATGISGTQESRDAVRRIVEDGSAALDGQGAQLNETVTKLGGATTALSGQREQFTQTLTSLDALVKTIAANEQTVREFLDQVAQGASLLAEQREEFRAALRSLDTAVTTISAFSRTHRKQITKTLRGSADLMSVVLEKQDQLTSVIRGLPHALRNVQSAMTRDGYLPARMDTGALLPLFDVLMDVCKALPAGLCEILDGTDIPGLPDLGDLLGGLGIPLPRETAGTGDQAKGATR